MIDADRNELERFVRTLFASAAPDGEVSLRSFYESVGARRAFMSKRVPLAKIDDVIDAAFAMAKACAAAPESVVFCPPVCSFKPNTKTAKESDILEGLCISVEIDVAPATGLATLAKLIGKPSMVVASGGTWHNETFDEDEPKLHAYWILDQPARSLSDLARLKHARRLACMMVSADPTNITIVHPLRWPGSVWRKPGRAPKLARLIA